MSKKYKEDEDIENEIDMEDDSDIDDEDINDSIEDSDNDEIIDTDEISNETSEESKEEIILSKHKSEGKHSLKYDSIFKGKKEDPIDEDTYSYTDSYHNDTIEVDKSSNYHFESINNESYVRNKQLKDKVYEVLQNNTDINFLNNRRKPSRIDFNTYYDLIKNDLTNESFTNVELFSELAVYFSDNLLNMFKLLDNKWRNLIISELQDHIGKNNQSKEIKNRNIYIGTEIEFEWEDEFNGNQLIITGDVIETIYEESRFIVNSYEKVYEVELHMITKILNNSKFKFNLNKLNNIDFL
jgi:hypothetical protein